MTTITDSHKRIVKALETSQDPAPIPKALTIWRSEGASVIRLGPGENCERLDLLLSNPNTPERHLQAVRAWLEKVLKRRG